MWDSISLFRHYLAERRALDSIQFAVAEQDEDGWVLSIQTALSPERYRLFYLVLFLSRNNMKIAEPVLVERGGQNLVLLRFGHFVRFRQVGGAIDGIKRGYHLKGATDEWLALGLPVEEQNSGDDLLHKNAVTSGVSR